MMRATFGLLISAALLAGPALAQPGADPSLQPPASWAGERIATSRKPADTGNTVSGVTVTPLPKKACAANDKDCVAMVVAELKRLYPEQLKRFSFTEQTKAARNQFTNDQLLDSLNGNGPPTPTAFPVSAALKTACDGDKGPETSR